MASFTAAGTSYATHGVPMVPFFIFYSMFGFQRVGDLIWAAADAQAKGFLLGATAGRTTLLGEGLQHQDGHSLVLASTVPTCQAYDPAFAYEMAAIVRHGLHRMYGGTDAAAQRHGDAVFYYLTLYNENYPMPARPDARRPRTTSSAGLYRWAAGARRARAHGHHRVLGLGPPGGPGRPGEALAAQHGIGAELWSATSYKRLREDALVDRALEPPAPHRAAPHPSRSPSCSTARTGPIVAVTDFMKAVPDQIARFVPRDRDFVPLGTDGFGRSDTREALRRFFETDAGHVEVAALSALAPPASSTPTRWPRPSSTTTSTPTSPDPRTR